MMKRPVGKNVIVILFSPRKFLGMINKLEVKKFKDIFLFSPPAINRAPPTIFTIILPLSSSRNTTQNVRKTPENQKKGDASMHSKIHQGIFLYVAHNYKILTRKKLSPI